MELTPTPVVRRRPWVGLVGVGLLLAAAGLLTPTALGLSQSVVRDSAMGGALHAGLWAESLVVGDTVPGSRLREGDVVSFVPPGRWADDGAVTRRVVLVSDDTATTRGDARSEVDPWRLDLTTGSYEQASVRVPLLGSLLHGPGLALLSGLGVGLLGLRLRRRPQPRGITSTTSKENAAARGLTFHG